MGVLGYVARASGVPIDARADHPFVDLGTSFRVVTQPDGDVWARFMVRVGELEVSAAVLADLSQRLAGRVRRRGRGAGRQRIRFRCR